MRAHFGRMHYTLLVVLGLVLTSTSAVGAQQVSAARAYDLQRVAADGEHGSGRSPIASRMVPIENPVIRGGVVGALVGGAVAAMATFAVIESSDRDFGIDGVYYSIFIPIGMAAGAAIGAIIGASR